MSETKYSLAIFFVNVVVSLERDSVIHSAISSAASLCSIQNTITSPILLFSGAKPRIKSSKRSRCLKMSKFLKIVLGQKIFLTNLKVSLWNFLWLRPRVPVLQAFLQCTNSL